MIHACLFFSIISLLSFNIIDCSDTTISAYPLPINAKENTTIHSEKKLTIKPFDYKLHAKRALDIGKDSLPLLVPCLPCDPIKRVKQINHLIAKLDVMLHNNTIMSYTKIIPDTLRRVVAVDDNNYVQGLMDFYIRADDRKGYIETLYADIGYVSTLYYDFIKYALAEIPKIEPVFYVQNHVVQADRIGREVCLKLGFKQIKNEDLSISFEYTCPNKQ